MGKLSDPKTRSSDQFSTPETRVEGLSPYKVKKYRGGGITDSEKIEPVRPFHEKVPLTIDAVKAARKPKEDSIPKFRNRLGAGTINEKQAEQIKKSYREKRKESGLQLQELKDKNRATLLKARETIKIEGAMRKFMKQRGLLGLGLTALSAGMAAKQAYDESENKQ